MVPRVSATAVFCYIVEFFWKLYNVTSGMAPLISLTWSARWFVPLDHLGTRTWKVLERGFQGKKTGYQLSITFKLNQKRKKKKINSATLNLKSYWSQLGWVLNNLWDTNRYCTLSEEFDGFSRLALQNVWRTWSENGIQTDEYNTTETVYIISNKDKSTNNFLVFVFPDWTKTYCYG